MRKKRWAAIVAAAAMILCQGYGNIGGVETAFGNPLKQQVVFAADIEADEADGSLTKNDGNTGAGEDNQNPGDLLPEEGANNSAMLSLDNENAYEGMTGAYSDGYVPTSQNGYMNVILPLICDGELKNQELRVSANLGDAFSMPFVCKNYEKTVRLAENKVNNGSKTISSYLIQFRLELAASRTNGNYPVMLHVNGIDTNGNPVMADYTVYVIVTDGIDPNAAEPEPVMPEPKEEPIVYTPKVLVKSYKCTRIAKADKAVDKKADETAGEETAEKDTKAEDNGFIASGDTFQLTVELWNTSETEHLKNASATIISPPEGFTLLSPSNAVYIGDLKAGATKEVTFEYQAGISVLPGQYDFGITCDYSYGKGAVNSDAGTAKATIGEHLNVQFDDIQIPPEAVVSDTVTASLQAMNLGKTTIYNVRATIEGDGLNPGGTLFIGNIEPGTAASSSVQVTISGLTESSVTYGDTKGTVTYYYEDADGNEYSETREFHMIVKSPFSDYSDEPEDEPKQWWIIMGIIGAVIALFIAVFIVGYVKRRKKYDEVVE